MLFKKMIRDIRKNLSQFITIFLMVMVGVTAYSGIEAYMDGMTHTADVFYRENNLQDLNVIGENFTKEDLEWIKNLDNVKDAERKLVINTLTDEDHTLLMSFIESNRISKFYIIEGEKFDKEKDGVWLDAFYAEKNKIKVGDTIHIQYENLSLDEKVRGLINVPDHIFDTKDSSELVPDRNIFGFAYASIQEIPESFIKENIKKESGIETEEMFQLAFLNFQYQDYYIFNYMMVDVKNPSQKAKVKEKIEEELSSAKAVINIEDTNSYIQYQGEIDEGKTYVGVFSGLFLFIAMLSVITTMTRVVKKQRTQIGTLKALGYTDRRVLFHYMGYGFWISVIASLMGLLGGYFFIGNIFMMLEMRFFEIPNGYPVLGPQCYIVASLVVVGVAFITYLTCRSILKESPAETLRNELPSVKKNSFNLVSKGIFQKLNFSSKWNIRDMVRNKMRTLMGIAGVVGCAMLIVCALGMLDSMNYFIDLQFDRLFHFDYKLVLKDNIKEEELSSLEEKYGAHTSKSYAIEIIEGKEKDTNNILIVDADDYIRFVDKSDEYIKIDQNDGVYITEKLSKTKGYQLGDTIKWHIYGQREEYTSKIVGMNRDPQNQNMTMTRAYFESLGLSYQPDTLYTNVDLHNTKSIPNVETIQDIEELKEGMDSMLSMMKTMLVLIISIAVILGAIIIYNLGILSYTEKQYQFATLKVLGFKDKQIQKIFIKQNNWIAILSIIIGLPLGYYLTDWLFKTAIEENYDFGAYITIRTYIIAAIGTFLVSYLVSIYLSKKIKSIDMVSSLKGNE